MSSILPSVFALGPLALIALLLAKRVPGIETTPRYRTPLIVATMVQAVHFAEEAAFDFHITFPALFGQPPMPWSGFVAFNLGCLALWSTAAYRAVHAPLWATWAAWFLALAGVLNGVAHPAMAWIEGGYFPGLVTSPLIALACLVLVYHLSNAERP